MQTYGTQEYNLMTIYSNTNIFMEGNMFDHIICKDGSQFVHI